MKKILGVIPARGGSKGIPKKNLFELKGKPLIYYTIEAAKKSKLLTDFVVSTDNEEIKQTSLKFGARVPFLRPESLATDSALAVPTIKHALLEMEKINDIQYDIVIMLQPTAPLRKAEHIDGALEKLINSDADSIISIVDVDNYHPMKMKIIKNGNLFDFQEPPMENPPRQILPDVYIVNGAIYATKRDIFVEMNSFKGNKSLPFLMKPEVSVNIDHIKDFLVADFFLD